jgi:tRNA modification GTPase
VIVSEEPGTTRDMVEEELSLSGIAVRIIDTAGIRESVSFVEKEGIRRSVEIAQNADLLLIIVDGSIEGMPGILEQIDIDNFKVPYIFVVNKSDLPQKIDKQFLKERDIVYISAKYIKGLENLRKRIVSAILPESENFTESVVVTRKRHVELLKAILESVERAKDGFDKNLSSEFISADLEEAKSALSQLTGKSVTEEVINRIFSDFCIGK